MKPQDTVLKQLNEALPLHGALVSYLIQENINPNTLYQAARLISEITDKYLGSQFGQVHILIENGVIRFVKGEHQIKVNEPARL